MILCPAGFPRAVESFQEGVDELELVSSTASADTPAGSPRESGRRCGSSLPSFPNVLCHPHPSSPSSFALVPGNEGKVWKGEGSQVSGSREDNLSLPGLGQ